MTARALELRALQARRWRVAVTLTAVMFAAYFGFIVLVAFAQPLMGHLLGDGQVSVGILAGAGVILLAPLLTGIYVRWANRHHDGVLASLERRGPR